jgi:hypothetical protein
MQTLIKAPIVTSYSEIFQTKSLLFSFVTRKDEVFTQLFQPVKCRDFLGDLIYSKKTGEPVHIYGFSYSYKKDPYDEDMLRMSLTFPNEETLQNFCNNARFLISKEEKADVATTFMNFLKKDPLTIVIEADPIWQSNSWKLSLFSYYLKLMCYPDVTKPEQPESEYAQKLTKEIEEKLLSKLNVMEEFPPEYPSISGVHNYSGFVSIIRGYNTKEMQTLLLGT